MTLFQLISRFIRAQRRPYLLAAAMLVSIALLSAWLPRRIGNLIDGLVSGQMNAAHITTGVLQLLALALLIYLLRVGWRLTLFTAAYRFGVQLRRDLYARLTAQGPAFYQQQRTGGLMALATNDIDAVEMVAGEAVLAGFDGTLTLMVVLAMMTLAIDWRLSAIALLPFPLMALGFWRISRQVHEAAGSALQQFGKLNDHVQENLAGVRLVRALGLEAHSARQFATLAEEAATANFNTQRWEAAYEPVVGITLASAGALTLGVGGYLVWQQQLTIGALTGFTIYLGQLIWPMFAAGWVLALVERGRAAWQRLSVILDAPLSIDDAGRIEQAPQGALQIRQLSLCYPGRTEYALQQLSLTLLPGQTLALVGPTGCGKSTLLRVLLRQYAPSAGSVEWGAHRLEDYQLDALRAAIAWVPQEAFLFSASIAENIGLARPDASRVDIEQVARLAAIDDEIQRFPEGYDTEVGERGITLSGGQRQRLAIARALLAGGALLLLDDALSAVDTDTAARIVRHLRTADGHSTRMAIIASHRLSAIAHADQIIVLQHGRATERGSHAELLAADGWYARQWRYQQLEANL